MSRLWSTACSTMPTHFFLPNALHFIQPLDNVVLALFKKTIRSLTLESRFQLANVDNDTVVAMHAIAYDAEAVSFNKQAIKRAFDNCGIAPFWLERIMVMANENAGVSGKDQGIQNKKAMRRAAETMLSKDPMADKVLKGKAKVQSNQLYSPVNLVAADHERRETDKRKKAAKKQAQEEKAKEKERKKVACTCGAVGCGKCSWKMGDAKGWQRCASCGTIFCKDHHADFAAHCIRYSRDNSTASDNEMVGV